jgi:hypothetical protein
VQADSIDNDLIVRPYTEIVDDVLVALVGGVVNERSSTFARRLSAGRAGARRPGHRGEIVEALPDGRGAPISFQPNVD